MILSAKTGVEHQLSWWPHSQPAINLMSSTFSYQLVNSVVRGITKRPSYLFSSKHCSDFWN